MKATFFLAIALLAAVVSAGDISQVQQGGTRGSDSSAKGGLAGVGIGNGGINAFGSTKKEDNLSMTQNANN
ncbi:predicted protein [Lichtheimia corymbifera JMRC:FSU:9682]|uniref:Uncharacterized protein n=1 Tax=Lichtheimia corymbifera JMRC:FSU:9682 TaxID=1263082 RepID=A0A068S9D6_9FUNG|nr:predicted protein [Lichtheimia corymbifera JMRC:FSU:9682]